VWRLFLCTLSSRRGNCRLSLHDALPISDHSELSPPGPGGTLVSRRTFLAGSAAVAAVDFVHPPASRALPPEKSPATLLWYERPATAWEEALPVGNGRIGAMVFGGVEEERLQLNEDTLWSGGPYDPVNPQARAALPEVRRLIEQ